MRDTCPHADVELHLDALPSLPQSQTVRDLAPKLWQDQRVRAVWLGGSFATGTADLYSDIDVRVAVVPSDLRHWEALDLDALLGAAPLAKHFLRVGEATVLHHLILSTGDVLDLLVQSAESAPSAEPTLVLGCRDEAFAELLAASNHAPSPMTGAPATGSLVRELVIDFWVHSHNHRKVLARQLDLMFPAASYANWQMLMRLWYIAATGHDVSPQHFTSIYGLTPLTQAVASVCGPEPLAICGAPTRTRAEMYSAIERYRDVVSQLGRSLAERYSFEYPVELEAMTRREWHTFQAVVSSSAAYTEHTSTSPTGRSERLSTTNPTHE
jgi:hypothetical protein